MADSIVTPLVECVKCVGPLLKKHLYDFAENVDDFLKKKSELIDKKRSYDQRLAIATGKKELPTKDVESWIREYEAIIRKCELPEYNEVELERKKSRRRYTIKRYNFSKELVKMTTEMTEHIHRYSAFGSLFVEDLVRKNSDILMNFENTKRKFEALTAFTSLEELSDQFYGIEKWRQEYEEMKRKCDGIENNLKNYNTEGESVNVGMEDLEKKTTEMTVLIDQYNQFFPFQNKKKEHQLSAVKNRKNLSEMIVDQRPQIVEKRSTDYMSLNSREKKKIRVHEALKEERVIKLFGMGGIGKTTLMEQINNEMSNGIDFKLVIWVTVSTTYSDVKDIQSQIFHKLNLPWIDREDNTVRAEKLSEYFKERVDGCCLFIFDDVWGTLDLKAIGIPNGNYGNNEMNCCKIVLTTRDKKIKVINGMLPKDIEMILLNEIESWSLFQKYASMDNNVDQEIKELATEVCRKCGGLPLVISVIAKMLCGEKEKITWLEILEILNKNDPSLDHYLKEVYVPLKLSYDRLGRKDLKIGFLICSLFPEDHEIKLNDLICYVIGAGEIAESCRGLNACRNIFIHLKNKGLLQDVKEDSARMHKVIRDVAIFIAKDEFGGFFCNDELTKWISSMQNYTDQPGNIKAVKFQSLFGNEKIKSEHLDISVGMENVLLLDLRETSIPLQEGTAKLYIKKLKELRVLMYKNSNKLFSMNIKEYFVLHKLSVLCLQNVHIEKLDKDFSIQLCNLRVIDFSGTVIDVIKPKVFWNLHNKLEELHMLESFNKWQASDLEDGEYASFSELAELKKLHSLHVTIEDKYIFSNEYRPDLVFSLIECFSISYFHIFQSRSTKWNSNYLCLANIQWKNVANWIKDLLKKAKHLKVVRDYLRNYNGSTEDLHLLKKGEYLHNANGDNEVDVLLTHDIVNIMWNLRHLDLENLPTCKYAIQYSSNREDEGDHNLDTTSRPILPKAERLFIHELEAMENIFVITLTPNVIPKGSFEKLQRIYIKYCPRLKFIFPLNVANCLVQLHSLHIESCYQLEMILEKDNCDCNQREHVLFPELKKMIMHNLPKLESAPSRNDEKLENLKHRLLLDENSAPKLKLIEYDGVIFIDCR